MSSWNFNRFVNWDTAIAGSDTDDVIDDEYDCLAVPSNAELFDDDDDAADGGGRCVVVTSGGSDITDDMIDDDVGWTSTAVADT